MFKRKLIICIFAPYLLNYCTLNGKENFCYALLHNHTLLRPYILNPKD